MQKPIAGYRVKHTSRYASEDQVLRFDALIVSLEISHSALQLLLTHSQKGKVQYPTPWQLPLKTRQAASNPQLGANIAFQTQVPTLKPQNFRDTLHSHLAPPIYLHGCEGGGWYYPQNAPMVQQVDVSLFQVHMNVRHQGFCWNGKRRSLFPLDSVTELHS